MDDPMRIGSVGTVRCEEFQRRLAALVDPDVIEIGTMRSEPDRPTHHKVWAGHAKSYVMIDAAPGVDVDLVDDAHSLLTVEDKAVDAVIAVSVWEHLERPWIAARQMARILRPGGILYVSTHQTFPIHGYPSDFFRFTDKALALLFDDAGFSEVHAGYTYPCKIIPPAEVTRWNEAAPAYLNVDLVAVR